MKKILVTGSNGLLGQKITERVLQNREFELVATAKGPNRHPFTGGYTYAEMDILDPENVREVIRHFQPDAIIHTAAMTNVDTAEAQPEAADELNITAVKTLIAECERHHIQFIHLSTDFIFDGAAGPYAEDAVPNPLSHYGRSKLRAEEEIQASGCSWAILRTILVYGIVSDMSRSNIVLWAKAALEKGDPINVVNDQWRMPTLAEDLADACLLAAARGAKGIYHISGKDMMSVAELVGRVADYWKLDKSLVREISSASLNQSARRPVKTGFVLDKAIHDLGYKPHSFEEGLKLLDQQISSS